MRIFASVIVSLLLASSAAQAQTPAEATSSTPPFTYERLSAVPSQADAPIGFARELYLSCKEVRSFEDPLGVVIDRNNRQARGAAPDADSSPASSQSPPTASVMASLDDELSAFSAAAMQHETDGKNSMELRPSLRTALVQFETLCAKLSGTDPDARLQTADLDALRALRQSDGFAKGHLTTLLEQLRKDDLVGGGDLRGGDAETSAFSGLGGGAIADRAIRGLADFIVKRAKEEAIIAIREQIERRLCGDEAPAMAKAALPETCRVLGSLDGSLSLRAMGTSMHAAAVADIQQLPDVVMAYGLYEIQASTTRLGSVGTRIASLRRRELLAELGAFVTSEKLRTFEGFTDAELRTKLQSYETARLRKTIDSSEALEAGLTLGRLGYAFHREAKRGRDPLEIAAAIHAMPAFECESEAGDPTTCRQGMTTVRHASALLHALSGQELQTFLFDATRDGVGPLVIGGLLEAERIFGSSPINRGRTFTFELELFNATVEHATLVRQAMSRFGAAKAILTQLVDLEPGSEPLTDDERRGRIAEVIVLSGQGIAELSAVLTHGQDQRVQQKVTTAMKDFVEMAELSSSLVVRDWGAAALASMTLIERIPQNEEFAEHLLAFLPLLVEIANAESSAEVAAAFEAAAAPAGSYRAKYQQRAFSLNALVGPAAGGEYVSRGNSSGWSGAFSGFAPVGLHMTTPIIRGKDGRRWMHIGGMLSVLDLGALTTYRFDTELKNEQTTSTAEHAPEVGFAQVFSPGAFLTLGIARSPVIVGGGVSMSPRLREIQVDGQTFDANALRVMAFVALDVTLYQFR